MSLINELRSRFTPAYEKHATSKATKVHLWAATAAIEQIAAKRIEIGENKNLSDAGKAGEVRDFAQSLAPAVARARGAVVGAKRAIARQREALVPGVKDRNDVSAAMLRTEMRSFLRNMRPAEAIAFATSEVADATLFEAIFEVPLALSNLNDIARDRILQVYLDRNAGAQLADIAEQTEAVSLLETAVNAASVKFADAAGVKLDKLDDFLAEKAPKEAAKVVEAFAPAPKTAKPSAPSADPIHRESVPDWQKKSDEFHEKLLAEARADLGL
jgi:hypothetical protein